MSAIVTDNIAYCTSNVVSHNCVSMCTKKDYRLHCHLIGSHSIHKHLILYLHLAQILAPRSLSKILHHWPDILLDTRIHVPIIFLVNVSWWGKVVSLFPSAVPLPMHTDVWPMWEVVTRDLRKRGSSTRTGGRPFLIMSSLQHPTNLAWVGVLISITFCNEIQRSVCTTSTETDINLRFTDASSSWSNVFLSIDMYARISGYTFKKRFLWGPHDVGSDSLHGVTVLSFSSWFSNVGIHMTFYIENFIPIPFASINTLRVSCRDTPSFDTPLVNG